MKKNYVKIITGIALISILLLQGIWLYNTYNLLEVEFKENVSKSFLGAIEQESFMRSNSPFRKKDPQRKTIEGYSISDNDAYTNNRALQDFLYSYFDHPISLEQIDSIFKEQTQKEYKSLDYSLLITDSLGIRTAIINHGRKKFNGHLDYKETIQLRNIAPEYISLTVFSPYKVVFGKMLLMLTGSLVLAVIVIYGLTLQIKIIARQKRTAELRQDFTHAMIHDIKNPLTTILMGVDNLKSGKIDDKPQIKEQYYRIMEKEGKHILSITNKILTIAQLEGDKLRLSKQPVDISGLINSLTEKYLLNTTKEIRFHTELNGIENIYADYGYIYESFDNIIDNAVKYSKEQVNIDITCFKTNNYIEIKFRDNGIGIPVRDQKKIFEKFERASAVRKKQKISGFGLGLNYVYRVVVAHGGEIKVESAPGKYSEFTIYLPYNENDKTVTD
ncbi:MAG: HAMP domain-containing histidine kinase [Dysgonamonadaceae bacterium]|jgi:two-component system phosphate regulon sensor histidine kinase PhoR|nr:HAMP domain-containing histidine kinase [Dysgonamonadaceae bacterium]